MPLTGDNLSTAALAVRVKMLLGTALIEHRGRGYTGQEADGAIRSSQAARANSSTNPGTEPGLRTVLSAHLHSFHLLMTVEGDASSFPTLKVAPLCECHSEIGR